MALNVARPAGGEELVDVSARICVGAATELGEGKGTGGRTVEAQVLGESITGDF
jgi:hypothetical protein